MPNKPLVFINYEEPQIKKIELGTYFSTNATIDFLENVDNSMQLYYTITGNEDWAIIGQSKMNLQNIRRNDKITIQIQGIALKYGNIKIPNIKIQPLRKYQIKESGENQVINIIPRHIILGIPKQ